MLETLFCVELILFSDWTLFCRSFYALPYLFSKALLMSKIMSISPALLTSVREEIVAGKEVAVGEKVAEGEVADLLQRAMRLPAKERE